MLGCESCPVVRPTLSHPSPQRLPDRTRWRSSSIACARSLAASVSARRVAEQLSSAVATSCSTRVLSARGRVGRVSTACVLLTDQAVPRRFRPYRGRVLGFQRRSRDKGGSESLCSTAFSKRLSSAYGRSSIRGSLLRNPPVVRVGALHVRRGIVRRRLRFTVRSEEREVHPHPGVRSSPARTF